MVNNIISASKRTTAGILPAVVSNTRILKVLTGMFFILLSIQFTAAQNISKYYTLTNQGDHKLYFIYPQSGFRSNTDKLVFDLTHLDSRDYVTFNFTYTNKESLEVDSVSFIYDGTVAQLPAQRIYTEFKSKWVHRIGVDIPFEQMQAFFRSDNTPEICLSSNGGKKISLYIKKGDWKRVARIDGRILEIITLNKKQ
ncbi:hypothetical protein [Bacteroides sp. 51]|uniref:hypothetical protein n=1 Tax=Bacteroides sp. 51 TaxID=2302938 RepID=UPI0013D2DFFB|nr:hypothetical protein [Bacteroides sp. 51]NDV80520.1 hypothetical protein [Bacteroides sp. 51]